MNFIKARLRGGNVYDDVLYWKKLSKLYPEITWFKDILKCTQKKYFFGGTRISESNYYKKRGEFLEFKNGIKLVIPDDKDIRIMKDEFMDIVLPTYCKNKYDFSEINDFMNEGPYEINEEVSVKKDDIVIDCGANMGMFSAVVAERAEKIYAFEPSRIIVQEYLSRLQGYYDNIDIQQCAVSDKTGETVFSYNVNNIGASHIGTNNIDKCVEEKVSLITLDEFVKMKKISRIDFIKADIEGAERDMLKGAKRVLKEFAPKLAICTYHLPDDKEVLERIIKEANNDYIIEHRYKKIYAYVK